MMELPAIGTPEILVLAMLALVLLVLLLPGRRDEDRDPRPNYVGAATLGHYDRVEKRQGWVRNHVRWHSPKELRAMRSGGAGEAL